MRYRLALFDFDGTLADSYPWFLGQLNQLADQHRFRRIEEHEVETLRGQSARQVLEALGVALWKVPRIARQVRREMAADIHAINLFPGMDQVLRGLAGQGVELRGGDLELAGQRPPDSRSRERGVDPALRLRRLDLRQEAEAPGGPARQPDPRGRGDRHRRRDPRPGGGPGRGNRLRGGLLGLHQPRGAAAQAPEEVFACPEEILRRLGNTD